MITATRYVLLFLSLALVIFEIIHGFKKNNSLISIPAISWALHSIIFYLCLIFFYKYFNPIFLNSWSSAIRFHAILTFMTLGIYRNFAIQRR